MSQQRKIITEKIGELDLFSCFNCDVNAAIAYLNQLRLMRPEKIHFNVDQHYNDILVDMFIQRMETDEEYNERRKKEHIAIKKSSKNNETINKRRQEILAKLTEAERKILGY